MEHNESTNALPRLLTKADLVRITGYKPSTIAQKVREGQFPAPFHLADNARAVRWLESEILQLIEHGLKRRDCEPVRPAIKSPAIAAE